MDTNTIPRIKGLPPGWTVLQFYECQCKRDRDAVILCERTVDDGDHGTRYVVWWVNMELGGCNNGDYQDEYEDAHRIFLERKGRLK